MAFIKEFFAQNPWVLIGLIAIAILLLIYIIFRVYRKYLINKIHSIEIEINTLRSTPLTYKLNKAVGLTKVNTEVLEEVNQAQAMFAEVTTNFDTLVHLLGDAEDQLLTGKLSTSRQTIVEINDLHQATSEKVELLDNTLDRLLEEETRLRDNIHELKNKFRDVRKEYTKKMNTLTLAQNSIEQAIHELELQFNTFEEWMFGSQFDKAQDVKVAIENDLEQLASQLDQLPKLIELAQGLVPHLVAEVENAQQAAHLKGVYLQHLDIDKNISLIEDGLSEDLEKVKHLHLEGVLDRLNQSVKRLEQLQLSISREDSAFDQVEGLSVTLFTQQDGLNTQIKDLLEAIPQLKTRFGFDQLGEQMLAMDQQAQLLNQERDTLKAKLENEKLPFTALLVEFNDYLANVSQLQSEVQIANRLVSNARHDEQRAIKQLLKLNLIMNEIQVKIDSRHLPHIANNYSGDMYRANQMLVQIKNILGLDPLNIKLLNSSVSDTIDFIYRLYNNVNNLVGTVDMVENALVYANRFRSSYSDLDSELTRAEVLFRNGEYTLALKSTIFAIEKLQPNAPYEQMIMDNSRSA